MTDSPQAASASADRLMTALARLLGDSMGAELAFLPGWTRPLFRPFALLAAYVLLWASAEVATCSWGWKSDDQLVSLLAWGACYITVSALLARHATERILATVKEDVVPYAPPSYLDAVARDLDSRAAGGRAVAQQLLIATLFTAAFVWAIRHDLNAPLVWTSPQVLVALAFMFLRFVVSARMAAAASFYLSFAERLETQPSPDFYVLGAADSSLVKALAKVASQVLTFWVLTFLAILPVMVLALPWLGEDFRFPLDSRFLLLFIPATGFFSLGIGSITYLRSEASVRAAVWRFTLRQAAILQKKSNALFDPASGRLRANRDQLQRLTDLQDRVLAGGRYGSPAGTAVSIALPFLLPAASLIKYLLDSLR